MDAKLAMVVAISKALEYTSKRPNAMDDEIMSYVMKEVDARGESMMSAVAAATKALKYKQQNPSMKEKEIMQKVLNESEGILTLIKQKI
jgi:hypothetical protein